ncbi:MAG: DEAD/DEAH box helicase, partial [Bacteroidia bacterium]|nr:DEAD/DEAH box helicase [Bacteroidia bacterium]
MKRSLEWFKSKGWKPHAFQKETWQAIADGKSGLLNAPTGYGKTYGVWFGIIEHALKHPEHKGLHSIWLTPLRALSKEIEHAATVVSDDLNIPYNIGLRTGDTSPKERQKQKINTPKSLISTPETLHLMMSQKGYTDVFKSLEFVVVDEWHELLGSKRGVQIELALSRLKKINPSLKIWGISATIGNMQEAANILLGT